MLRGQELENAVVDVNYIKAIRLAFELQRPHKLFELLSGLSRSVTNNMLVLKVVYLLTWTHLPLHIFS